MMLNTPKPMTAQEKLFRAANAGDVVQINEAVKEGADPTKANLFGNLAIHLAADAGKVAVVDLLLQRDSDRQLVANQQGFYPFHLAVMGGHVDVVDSFISKGCGINTQTNVCCNTPLHIAVMRNNLPMVTKLLEKGASYNVKNKAGKTPFELALYENQQKSILDMLFGAGAGVGVQLNLSKLRNNRYWGDLEKTHLLIGTHAYYHNHDLFISRISRRAVDNDYVYNFKNTITNYHELESAIAKGIVLSFAKLADACTQTISSVSDPLLKEELLQCSDLLQQRADLDLLRAFIKDNDGYERTLAEVYEKNSELFYRLLALLKPLSIKVIAGLLTVDELKNMFNVIVTVLEMMRHELLTRDQALIIKYLYNALHLIITNFADKASDEPTLINFRRMFVNIILLDEYHTRHQNKKDYCKSYHLLTHYLVQYLIKRCSEYSKKLQDSKTSQHEKQLLEKIQDILTTDEFSKQITGVVLDKESSIAASSCLEQRAKCVFKLIDAQLATDETLITAAKSKIIQLLAAEDKIHKNYPALTQALKQIPGIDTKAIAAATVAAAAKPQVPAAAPKESVLSLHFAKPADSASDTAPTVNSAQHWQGAPDEKDNDSTATFDL